MKQTRKCIINYVTWLKVVPNYEVHVKSKYVNVIFPRNTLIKHANLTQLVFSLSIENDD